MYTRDVCIIKEQIQPTEILAGATSLTPQGRSQADFVSSWEDL